MEYLSDPWLVAALLGAGVLAGFINTLAGGGGLLILPLLMLSGMGAALANGTMRVGVLIQSIEAVRQFNKRGTMPFKPLPAILVPCLLGTLVGALAAAYLPETILKPVLLGTLVVVALLMVLKPNQMTPGPDEVPQVPEESLPAWLGLFFAGVYGGFVQAGVGFVLIAVLVGQMRYDLLRGNALKLAITGSFTVLALGIFMWRDQVAWLPGLVVAAGTLVGVRLGVGFAHRVSPVVLKRLLLVMVLTVCLAAAIKG
ncbi:MAG: permease [Alcanivoracaceae bacterium]|nr:permease [Alcanivoracaceae bacterium]|tara:strand:- start:3756 stop:4523 length:768 start_codon:yes stop_codon:yes gene_type:complete